MALPLPALTLITNFHIVTKVNAGKGSAMQTDNSSIPTLEDDP